MGSARLLLRRASAPAAAAARHGLGAARGYDRIDTPAGLAWLNAIYEVLDVYANLVLPSLKLVRKTRVGSKVSKRYDTARTPLDRLLDLGAVHPHRIEDLTRRQQTLNPLELRRTLDRLQRQDPIPLDLPQAAD